MTLPDLDRLSREDERLRRVAADAAARGGRETHSSALTRLGASYRCAGRYDQAEAALREALERRRERGATEPVASTGRALPAVRSAG